MSFLTDYDTLWRFFHILSGIVWIGLLYFFNLVNLPLIKLQLEKPYKVDMAEKATPHIALKSLFWFRYGALFTLITGLLLLESGRMRHEGLGNYLLGHTQGHVLLIGILLAIVMFINVWFIIWPNQKVILGNNKKIAGGVDDAEKKRLTEDNAPRLKNAVMASRFNTWASVPMLFGMVFGAHGVTNWTVPIAALAVVLILMIVFSNKKQ